MLLFGIVMNMLILISFMKRLLLYLIYCIFILPMGIKASVLDSTQIMKNNNGEALFSFVRNIERFNHNFPQEKVYLHFDNTGYFRGETIWFKAYVVRADSYKYTDMSSVLYVELLNPTGDVIETRKLKVKDGQADGSFKLDNLFTSGFYEVRAYTRYMTNWDDAGIFSRVFPVFNAPKKEGDYSHPVISELGYQKRLPDVRVADEAGDTIHTERDGKMTVRFFPEGGRLVRGLQSRVAFDITAENGQPTAEYSGFLTLSDGEKTEVRTFREGRGVFDYIPGDKPAVMTLTDRKGREREFVLPEADSEGCVMRVEATSDEFIDAIVTHSPGVSGLLGMVLVNSGNVEGFSTINFDGEIAGCRFKKSSMTEGVNQITLINDRGEVVAERMVFVYPHKDVDTIGISGSALSPCGKVVIEAQTRPKTTFSIAIRDYDNEVNGAQSDAATYLLLSSDLKGYIHNPAYYLESDDEEHRRATDLLMMVQGWRRYDITQMMNDDKLKANRPIEDRLLLMGRLKQVKKKYDVENVNLSATLYNEEGVSLSGKAVTDKDGNYAFSLPDCEGEWTLLMNTKFADKNTKYGVRIDRNFYPAPRQMGLGEAAMLPLLRPLRTVEAVPDFDEKIPVDRNSHMLKDVKVKGRRRYKDATSAWESERRGAYSAVLRYDCTKAAEEFADRGENIPGLFSWLETKNPLFEKNMAGDNLDFLSGRFLIILNSSSSSFGETAVETEDLYGSISTCDTSLVMRKELLDDGPKYKGRPMVIILNNEFYTISNSPFGVKGSDFSCIPHKPSAMLPDDLSDCKTVYISESSNSWTKFLDLPKLSSYKPVTLFIYTHRMTKVKNKGVRRTFFDGYSKAETFDMPDYSLLPPMEDHRRTLYWNPNVETDKNGRAQIEFYNNSTCRQIVVSAETITKDGKAVVYRQAGLEDGE